LKFVFDLLSKTSAKSGKGNLMLSPASIMFALDLAAAGAGGDTLMQITEAAGRGDDPGKTLKFASDFIKRINSSEGVSFKSANAEWFNEDIFGDNVNKDYLNYVEEMYGAEVNFSSFNDRTLNEINEWTSENTNEMIPRILTELKPSSSVVLVNAIAFDGKWEKAYSRVQKSPFRSPDGDQNTSFLYGSEKTYFENEEATGFKKDYEGGQYSFLTMLPKDENIRISDFVSGLTYDKYKAFIDSKTDIKVVTGFPEFRSEFQTSPVEVLRELGIKDAFDPKKADFRGIADSGLFIETFIHKSVIEVNREGTKAAAASAGVTSQSALSPSQFRSVILDRPFVYAIVDNATDMPVFIGSLEKVEK